MLGCIRIWSQKTAGGFERDQPAKRAGLAGAGSVFSKRQRREMPGRHSRDGAKGCILVEFGETTRLRQKNTNQSDKGTIATSNAAPAINAADGEPQTSCKRPAASGPTAINT